MSDFELELPSIYGDVGLEDAAPATTGHTPVLINQDPEQDEFDLPINTSIQLDIATIDSAGTINAAATFVYVNGVLAFNAGAFTAGFNGPVSASSNPQPDVLRIVIDPTTDFTSEELVEVRVVTEADDGSPLDTTYHFTTVDIAPPVLISAVAIDLQRVRVTFNESVKQTTAADPTSALDPADWQIDRFGDYLHPIVSAKVASVDPDATPGQANSVDLITDIPLTPGGTYQLTATALTDIAGNVIIAPDNVVQFLGWRPPVPEGRQFDLYKKIPALNRREDDTQDLLRFILCLQEVTDLLLYDIDKWIEILDPDTAPEAFVDAMLGDLGNPFAFDLSLTDKRRLAQILVAIYRSKGTGVGIIAVIRFFMGFDVTIDAFNLSAGTWILGDSELGATSILATDDSFLLYAFTVTVMHVLTDVERKQLRSIVDYMKPAHTHFVRLIEPEPVVIVDHWELGVSELGENTFLH